MSDSWQTSFWQLSVKEPLLWQPASLSPALTTLSSLLRKSSPALRSISAMLLWKFCLLPQEALLPLPLRTNCPASVRLSLSHDKSCGFLVTTPILQLFLLWKGVPLLKDTTKTLPSVHLHSIQLVYVLDGRLVMGLSQKPCASMPCPSWDYFSISLLWSVWNTSSRRCNIRPQ